jgi:hypothetical protein
MGVRTTGRDGSGLSVRLAKSAASKGNAGQRQSECGRRERHELAQRDPRLARGIGGRPDLLSGIVAAVVGAILGGGGASSSATEGGTVGLIGLLITLLLAFIIGGYVAGRLASRSGLKHGLLVPVLMLVVTIVLAGIGALLGLSFLDNLSGVTLPSTPSDAPQGLGTILTGAGILALLMPFIGGAIGGALGARTGRGRP